MEVHTACPNSYPLVSCLPDNGVDLRITGLRLTDVADVVAAERRDAGTGLSVRVRVAVVGVIVLATG